MLTNIKAGLASPHTTTSAILLVVYTLSRAVFFAADNDVSTIPDWSTVVAAVIAAYAFLNARDANKTSRESGAE
jgi:hypothetical protein